MTVHHMKPSKQVLPVPPTSAYLGMYSVMLLRHASIDHFLDINIMILFMFIHTLMRQLSMSLFTVALLSELSSVQQCACNRALSNHGCICILSMILPVYIP